VSSFCFSCSASQKDEALGWKVVSAGGAQRRFAQAILGQETQEASHCVASGLGEDEGQDFGK